VEKQHVKLAENFPYRLLKVMKSTLTLKGWQKSPNLFKFHVRDLLRIHFYC